MNLKKHVNTEDEGSTHQHPKIVMNVDKDPLLCEDIYFQLMQRMSPARANWSAASPSIFHSSPQEEKVYELTRNTVDPDAVHVQQLRPDHDS